MGEILFRWVLREKVGDDVMFVISVSPLDVTSIRINVYNLNYIIYYIFIYIYIS
jgi:hypothetical protein